MNRFGRLFASAALLLLAAPPLLAADPPRPNVLWLTCEDMGPHLGCYGDTQATTPHLDRLAARSLRYRTVWSCAPVCAPARTTLISGLYPPSTGSEHMRSMTRLPPGMKLYPQYLREAGYYCTNHSKEDYNLEKPGQVWDESSAKAHWRNRRPGQPFFAVFNVTTTHESQIRKRPHTPVHDPARVRLPAYHPDTPEVRRDWAQYYDNITTMDAQLGERLKELAEAGLAEDTVVFFYSDHGSGMPRSKRTPYNSGLAVPLLVHIPAKHRHLAPADYGPGAVTGRLVSFVDFAPTALSLVGVRPPDSYQGRAFLGPHAGPPQDVLHGFRGRMDERPDLVRSARDARYVYVRNYLPHRPHGQHVAYQMETPTTRVWKRLFDEGKLQPPRTAFWERRAPEELYDLVADPDETRNLAADPAHEPALRRLRQAQQEHARRIRDVGFLPEDQLHARSGKSSPYELGHDDSRYPYERVWRMAEDASLLKPEALPILRRGLGDPDDATCYWAVVSHIARGREAVQSVRAELRGLLANETPSVRIAAAEALGRHGDDKDARAALGVLLELAPLTKNNVYVSVQALNALGELGPRAAPGLDVIRGAAAGADRVNGRMKDLVPRLVEKLLADAKEWK